MSGQTPNDSERWADDPRLSAFALGELEGAERDEVARLVAGDPTARAFVEDVRRIALDLETALAGEGVGNGARLTDVQRSVVAARASARRTPWPRRVGVYAGMAAAAGLAAAVTLKLRGAEFGQVFDAAGSAPRELAAALEVPRSAEFAAGAEAQAPAAASRYVRDFDVEVAQGAAVAEPLDSVGYVSVAAHDPAPEAARAAATPQERVDGLENVAEEAEEEEPPQLDDPAAWNREGYDRIVENAFVPTRVDALSTFSIDVDTASYTNVRRMLRESATVPPDAVRIEEFVNYFSYAYEAPAPTAAHPFAVHVGVAAAPWAPQHRLVRIGLKARDIERGERAASNLVFLLDVSGSMDDPQKLPLVKRALALLVEQLGPRDRVAIVVYAGAEGLALETTPGDAREAILQTIERLNAGGSTNGGAGIALAYKTARASFLDGGLNRVILCTDGDFNVGLSSDGDLERLIEKEARSGVFLTVLGFGSDNWQDAKMEKLSNRGNGNFAYIDSLSEARKVLVEQVGGTLAAVAKDVKIQVEFNPAEVQAARLIGYENRVLAHQDFLDDAKDAGEIGAGHTVTALYEVIPRGAPYDPPAVPESRFTTPPQLTDAATSGELLTVRLRYKQPDGDTSTGFEVPVKDAGTNFHQADEDTRFAAAVAAFGMVLRQSQYVGKTSLRDVRTWAVEALGEDRGGYRAGFLELVDLALRQR